MHLLVQAAVDTPPRRFVFFSSAAPTAPLGSAFLASLGCYWVSPRLELSHAIGLQLLVRPAWRSEDDVDSRLGRGARPSVSVLCI
jgi:hypothetical protein